jgi:hypothetical protein
LKEVSAKQKKNREVWFGESQDGFWAHFFCWNNVGEGICFDRIMDW